MMMRNDRLWIAMALLAIPLLTGCSTDYYRAETRLHPDGQIDRAIYQPHSSTPEKVRQTELWKQTRGAKQIESGAWTGSIEDLPEWTSEEEPAYFAAWNRFASVEKIPDHFIVQSPDESRQGRLIRKTSKTDLVFVTEHRWHETLTDIVTLDDMHIANRELAALYTSYVDDVLAAGLGKEYDYQPLIDWMKGEGTQWFVELTVAYYEAGILRALDGNEEGTHPLQQKFDAVFARHNLKNSGGEAVQEFAEAKLRELVRRKDGRPLDDETADSILIWMTFKKVENANGENIKSPLEEVAKKVVATKYGGKEQFSLRMMALASRIWGLYGPFTTPRQFAYSLEMPGVIVESTGAIQSDTQTRWSFNASEAYPLGYRMTSRSLQPNVTEMKKLLNAQPLNSRQTLLSFVDIVAADEPLLEALQQCRRLQSMSALENYLVKIESANSPDNQVAVARVKRLWQLLKLPD